VAQLLATGAVRLVVVDSIAALFRGVEPGTAAARAARLARSVVGAHGICACRGLRKEGVAAWLGWPRP
jgi:RecA/RadA recombinase